MRPAQGPARSVCQIAGLCGIAKTKILIADKPLGSGPLGQRLMLGMAIGQKIRQGPSRMCDMICACKAEIFQQERQQTWQIAPLQKEGFIAAEQHFWQFARQSRHRHRQNRARCQNAGIAITGAQRAIHAIDKRNLMARPLQPNSRRNADDTGAGNHNMSHGMYLHSVRAKLSGPKAARPPVLNAPPQVISNRILEANKKLV